MDFKKESAMSQEITILEGQLAYAEEIKEKLKIAQTELIDLYRGLLNAHDEFNVIKKENIEEIRRYKFSVSSEAKEIEASIKRINCTATVQQVQNINDFVKCCESLDLLRRSGFFNAFKFND